MDGAGPTGRLTKGAIMHVLRTLGVVIVLLTAAGASAAPLCTSFVIKQSVPRQFAFTIPKNAGGQTFMLDASVESQKGTIYCMRGTADRADCRATKNPQDPVVVTLNLASTDPDSMGEILAGFSAGNFSIGKGGWTLKCGAAPKKSSAPPKPKKAD